MEWVDKVICGDALEVLRLIPDGTVQVVITSPPYWHQRDYGYGGIGSEDDVESYIEALLAVLGECLRCLRQDGSIFFNLGDKYSNGGLMLLPWRFLLAAVSRFPIKLPNIITWVKSNPKPINCSRRLVASTEPFFHFVKSDKYYYCKESYLSGLERFRQKYSYGKNIGKKYRQMIDESPYLTDEERRRAHEAIDQAVEEFKRGEIATFRLKIRGTHPLTYQQAEAGKRVRFTTEPFRIIKHRFRPIKQDVLYCAVSIPPGIEHPAIFPEFLAEQLITLTSRPGDIVLDPFLGSGTVAIAAKKLGRHYIGIDINPEYCQLAEQRLAKIQIQPNLFQPIAEVSKPGSS